MVVDFIKKLFGLKPAAKQVVLPPETFQKVNNKHPTSDGFNLMVGVYMPLPFYVDFKAIPSVRKPKNCSEETAELYKKVNEWRRKCIKLSDMPLIHRRFMDLDNFGKLGHNDMMFVFQCNGRCDNLFYSINEWAMVLLKITKDDIAKSVLEYAVELRTDAPKTYELLGNIYFKQSDVGGIKKLHAQLSQIEIPGAARDRVLERLYQQISRIS